MAKRNRVGPTPDFSRSEEEDVEMQKLTSRGIDLEHVENEEQQFEILEKIRELPCPVRTKIKLRDRLFSGPVRAYSNCGSWRYQLSRSLSKTKSGLKEFYHSVELWGGSFRSIEGHQGTGVLSYFVFLRWLLGLNLMLFLLLFGFIVIPHFFLPTIDYSKTSTNSAVNLSYQCTSQYNSNVTISPAASDLVADFFQGTGFMEQTQLFYGHYWGSKFLVGSGVEDSFVYNVPLAYFLVSAVCLLISLFLMARYTARSLRSSMLNDQDSGFEYCNKVFGSWDFTLSDEHVAKIKHNSIFYDIASDLTEERFEKERADRLEDDCSKCGLYTIRFFVNFFVLCCLGGGGYLIYFVTSFSTAYASDHSSATGNDAYVLLLVQYLPSITITALNAGVPIIFGIIVKAEHYKQAFVIKITLIRTVFLRLASLTVLVVSLYTEISCSPRDSCLTPREPCSVIYCWETYVGQQMYKLIILNFLVTVVKVFLVEFPRKLVVSKCQAKIFQKIGPPEFQIPTNVLDLVYTQTVCWIGFFFSPLIPGIVVAHLFIVFYCKKLSALYACEPSQRPYRAARSNSFFMIVLLLAFFLCCVPVGYTMSELSPSKSCGPFRIYEKMYGVLEDAILAWPTEAQAVYKILTSSAVVTVTIVLLGLLVYYCSNIKNAHQEMNKMLKHQLTLEGHDVQFLVARIQELTGEKAPLSKKRNKPKGSPNKAVVSDKPLPGKKNGYGALASSKAPSRQQSVKETRREDIRTDTKDDSRRATRDSRPTDHDETVSRPMSSGPPPPPMYDMYQANTPNQPLDDW